MLQKFARRTILGLAAAALMAAPAFADGIEIGAKAPNFTLKTTDGATIELAQVVKQNKLTVVNFWATWCAPCIIELPEFSAKYNLFKQNGATILAVNAAEKEPVVQDFAKRSKLAFPLMVDTAGTTKRAYGVTALPVTLIIDRNGIVRDKIGDESSAAQLIARMQAAAKKAS